MDLVDGGTMQAESQPGLTLILGRARDGDEGARSELIEALDRLAGRDGRQAQVMTLRDFGGMTVAEVAAALGVSAVTVERDWRLARAWLVGQLGGDER
jgi:DNA-directed RNA polymerase specialized sigma24 family protein